MKAIDFPEQNVVVAETQPEYSRLPAFLTHDAIVISCWKMTWRERLIALVTGKIWVYQMTFGQKLQPQKVTVESPVFIAECIELKKQQSVIIPD